MRAGALALAALLLALGALLLLTRRAARDGADPWAEELGTEWPAMVIDVADYPPPPPGDWRVVPPGPVPVVNPLKGFMPYASDREYATFPYTLEYQYIPVDEVVICNGTDYYFDFAAIERLLNAVAGRGRQAVFRLFFDYPGYRTAIPKCLVEAGVQVRRYTQFGGGLTPDYDDPRMVELMVRLIRALGERYDGDPRIGFIQVGLLGHWGEWHTWPTTEWFASEGTQRAVLEAYDRSFNRTKLLVRYASRVTRDYRVGFHDDSFAYSTLGDEPWYFYNQIVAAGVRNRWQTEPIGGEVRPELQPRVFKEEDLYKHLLRCIETTRASFLLMQALFDPAAARTTLTREDLRRAAAASQRMGYTFAATHVSVEWDPASDSARVSVVVKNFGVAPFYYEWPVEFGVVSADGVPVVAERTRWTPAGILPGQTAVWSHTFQEASKLCGEGRYFAIRVPNPLPRGRPVLFANRGQLPNGWLLLLECEQR